MQERSMALPGAINLRDFGGYETEDGHRVLRNRLYRSGSLAHLTMEAQQLFVDEMRVNTVCDLRRPDERLSEPTPATMTLPRRVEIPIDPGSAVAMRSEFSQRHVPTHEQIDFMVAVNRDLARDHFDDYARVFAALLDTSDGAFLLHCSFGKDRTGLGCALILHALGVPKHVILHDYMLSNDLLLGHGLQRPGWTNYPGKESFQAGGRWDAVLSVRHEYLNAAYDTIDREFSGIMNYLEHAVGIDAAIREELRSRYLERLSG